MHEETTDGPVPEDNACAMALERCLSVGMDVFLDASPGSPNSKRFPAKLRGWETGHYILIAITTSGVTPAVRQGKECVLRFMHEGQVWGFSALFAEQALNGGYPLIQLYWPREVAHVQVRKHERVAIQTPCEVERSDGTNVFGTIGDLSGGGCSLMLKTEIDVGESLRLSFHMPDGGQVAQRPVIVRNRRAVPGRGIKYGCQFQAADEKDHGIQLFVARKIAIDRGESVPHPQILVLSRNALDFEILQQALASTPYEAVEAAGILDLGYRLHTCEAVAILISFEQRELSAIEVLPLIRQSPGMEDMPLVIYGGGEGLRDQARSVGVTLCIDGLADAAQILPYLRKPESEPEPENAGVGESGDAATDAEDDVRLVASGEAGVTTSSGDDEDEIVLED